MQVFIEEISETTGRLRVDLENRETIAPRGPWEVVVPVTDENLSRYDQENQSLMFKGIWVYSEGCRRLI